MTLVVHSIDKAFHLLNKLMDLVVHGYEFNDVVHSKPVKRRLFSLHVYNSVYVHSKPMSLIMLCVTLYQVLLFYISSFFFLSFLLQTSSKPPQHFNEGFFIPKLLKQSLSNAKFKG